MIEPTRRDDIISWFYSIIEMAKGKLPWKDVQDHSLSMSCKQAISTDKLCSGLPRQMKTIWSSIKDMEFEQCPDYDGIKLELDRALIENKFENMSSYDWEEKPDILKKLTPHPELFDKNLARTMECSKTKKKICIIA